MARVNAGTDGMAWAGGQRGRRGRRGWLAGIRLAAAVLLAAGWIGGARVAGAGEGDPGAGPAAGDGKTVRIGVVRLQEIVERYNRYVYVTARFTEDYKAKYLRESKVLDAIEKTLAEQTKTPEDNLAVLLDKGEFENFMNKGAKLNDERISAMLKLRDTEQLKDDLNTVMSLAVMEDIADAVKAQAAGQQFDYVTDFYPVDAAQRKLVGTGKSALDQSGGLMLENLQNRAPSLYADPNLDITEAVVKNLNDNYTIKYGAGDQADPLLTQPLETLAAGLKDRVAAFQAAQANRKILTLSPPVGSGYATGVVNLQTIITTLMQGRKYDVQFEDLERQLKDLGADYQAKQQTAKDHYREVQQALQGGANLPREKIAQMQDEEKTVIQLQREVMHQKMSAQALNFAMSNKLFAEITAEVSRQAQGAGLKLVVATFSDERSTRAENVERAMANKNMVVWYRKQAPIDLTLPVLKALSDQYQRYQAELIKNGQKGNPFDLPATPEKVLKDFIDLMQGEKKTQADEDNRRFQLWHTYQKEVLKVEPTPVEETPGKGGAATDVPVPANREKVVQPAPVPVAP